MTGIWELWGPCATVYLRFNRRSTQSDRQLTTRLVFNFFCYVVQYCTITTDIVIISFHSLMSSMTPNSTPQKVRRSTGHALPVPYYQGDQPPPKPDYNACPSTQDRLALKRSYEKEMFAYLMKFGTPAIDLCGPCERTNTPCIWHPASPKRCAYCFRGHDICEKWDDTMQSMGRRRLTKSMIRPASSSPEKRRKVCCFM